MIPEYDTLKRIIIANVSSAYGACGEQIFYILLHRLSQNNLKKLYTSGYKGTVLYENIDCKCTKKSMLLCIFLGGIILNFIRQGVAISLIWRLLLGSFNVTRNIWRSMFVMTLLHIFSYGQRVQGCTGQRIFSSLILTIISSNVVPQWYFSFHLHSLYQSICVINLYKFSISLFE